MFERYTDRARRTIVLSQDAARSMKHNYIGTEHLILGLATEEGGVASTVLAAQGVTPDALREQIGKIVGLGSTDLQGHIPFTPRTKKVLELALREALQLGCSYVGTEHLLLGLVREGEGIAAQALTYIKGDDWHAVLRTAVLDQLKGHAKAEQARYDGYALCACEHIRAHHMSALIGTCEWRGCGCPRFITADEVLTVTTTYRNLGTAADA